MVHVGYPQIIILEHRHFFEDFGCGRYNRYKCKLVVVWDIDQKVAKARLPVDSD